LSAALVGNAHPTNNQDLRSYPKQASNDGVSKLAAVLAKILQFPGVK
jgi:hypothetical protein